MCDVEPQSSTRASKRWSVLAVPGLIAVIMAGASHRAGAEVTLPPLSPAGEAPDDHSDPAWVAQCQGYFNRVIQSGPKKARIVRTLVTRSKTWGIVWRADYVYPDERRSGTWRLTCAHASIVLAPLETFDPAHENAPLPGR